MKKVFLLVFCLSGCSRQFNIEMFNNSELPLIVYADKAVTIGPGEFRKIGVFTSTKYVTAKWDGRLYKYAIDVSSVPGKYMASGWTHGIKLHVESSLAIYIRNPEFDFSMVNTLPDEQPTGFPVMPELLENPINGRSF